MRPAGRMVRYARVQVSIDKGGAKGLRAGQAELVEPGFSEIHISNKPTTAQPSPASCSR